jgi:hypothetical protein
MSSATSPSPRIPAWKRLGLKLKNIQDIRAFESPEENLISKRKRAIGSEEEAPPKMFKKSSKAPSAQGFPVQDTVTPVLVRKKSVTFTPETKAEDGDSIKQLFNTWLAEQKLQDPSFQFKSSNQAFSTPKPPHVEEHIDTTLDESERRVQRVKKTSKSQDRPKHEIVSSPNPSKIAKPRKPISRPFLDYLRQYSESRETWKFNKNHQTHLLKHVFDLDVIPSDHAYLIYKYVRGLQGGVRTRVRDTALAVKVKDQEEGGAGFPEDMPDPEKRQREYDAAMEEYVVTMTAANVSDDIGYEEGVLLGLSDSAMSKRVVKRMRSERVLAELGSSQDEGEATETKKPDVINGDGDSQKRVRMNDGSSQKFVRKRKQRTMVVDDETSSSEDSSNSDNDSSDEPITRNDGPEDTSSSSSSSSSSSEGEEDAEESSEEDSDEGEENAD